MPALDVADLRKAYGSTSVLHGLDLAVETGETVALLGPSGVGKSTLLRCIAGLEQPDAGTITLDGVDARAVPAHRRGVGYLFQDNALFPHLDVARNVAFGLRMQGVDRRQRTRRVAEVLDLVGLGSAADRNVASLSGGEAQRVALARALAPSPSILLLDEPFAGLDRTRRDDLIVELRALFDDLGLTVVAVTHDPAEAAMLADRIAVLLAGRIAQIGAPSSVLPAPANVSIARLLGHPNVTTAHVVAGVATTPWGPLGVATEQSHIGVVLPPDAVHIDPGGTWSATVEARLWRDNQPRLRVTAGAATLEFVDDLGGAERGDAIRLTVDADRVVVVDPG